MSPTTLAVSTYLLRLDWHLEGITSTSERRRILRTLRENIQSDPRPPQLVLADLGSPRALAARYGEGGRRRPLWSVGVISAAAALLTYWIVFGAFTGGMLAVVNAEAPMTADAVFLFVPVTAFSTEDGIGIGWSGGWEWLIVPAMVVAVSLLLGARAWRLFRRDKTTPQ
ncbi:hypothetical protein [Rathayibacter festucae]|uniref:hypothetical protein n=1 Tax=Rathayibacter festucae TaxID=110937 RepID=UPI002A6B4AAF|nr:hypothetical protein [Rathayibacter festucae]MDY0914511.1 hypothetical protein [Rathayibacter festucae]